MSEETPNLSSSDSDKEPTSSEAQSQPAGVWAEVITFDEPRPAVWHGPQMDESITVIGIYRTHSGEEFIRTAEGATPLRPEEVEYLSAESSNDMASSPDTVEQDTADNWSEQSDARGDITELLRRVGVDESTIIQVQKILDMGIDGLIRLRLASVGVQEEKIDETTYILTPVNLYLKKLAEIGLPDDKRDEAHRYLLEEVGQLRIEHLKGLVGQDREDELRKLMSQPNKTLLAAELKRMGFSNDVAKAIFDIPRRNKTRLAHEALIDLGLEDDVIQEVEKTILKAEIPPHIAKEAQEVGIPLEAIVVAREAFKRADWQDTFSYLKQAQENEGARTHLKEHGIEVLPRAETDEAKRTRLANMTLKEINTAEPSEWEAEKARRIARKKKELAAMLKKFRDYLPLKDLPLPADIEPPPEVKIPDDLLGAYGLWRNLLTQSYVNRISDEQEYKSVRSELKRVGGDISILRPVRQRILAFRILQKQKKDNPNANYGALGLGFRRYKDNFRSIQEADTRVQNARRALSPPHKNTYVKAGQSTPRIRLAENIVDIRLREIAYRELRLNPEIPKTGIFPGEPEPEHEELV